MLTMLLLGAAGLVAPVQPLHVTGGQPAAECQWPTTVAVKTGGGLCTGTLVHPSVVVYAAHCGADEPEIVVGQHQAVGEFDAAIDRCETNPDYLGTSDPANDWAYCLLAEPIDLPITPPLYGCETDAIEADAEVYIAGFGQTSPGIGDGSKHWAQTHIISTFGATATIGGEASTCPGDSGGSAFMRLDDGAWRAISMVSSGVGCESATHALMHPAVPWIETQSGIDITPCHDQDGTWAPGPDCGDFYAADLDASGSWDDMCLGLATSEPAATCGDAYVEMDGTTGDVEGTSSGGDEPDPVDQTTGEAAESSGSSGSDDAGAAEDATADGGCRTGGRSGPWLWLLVLPFARRRGAR